MDFIRHIRELRGRAIFLAVQHSLEPHLQKELSPKQVELVDDGALVLHDLCFSERDYNGIVFSLGVKDVRIDFAAVLCEVSGASLSIRINTMKQLEVSPTSKETSGDSFECAREQREATMTQTGVIDALTTCLEEVSGLLNAYLRVVVTELNISFSFEMMEHNSLVLDILVPRLDFHDATAEHYNNHADEMVECAIQHKVVKMDSFSILLNKRAIFNSESSMGLYVIAGLRHESTRVEVQMKDVHIETCSARVADLSVLATIVAQMRNEDSTFPTEKHRYRQKLSSVRSADNTHGPDDLSLPDVQTAQKVQNRQSLSSTGLTEVLDAFHPSFDDERRLRLMQLYHERVEALSTLQTHTSVNKSASEVVQLNVSDEEDGQFFDCADTFTNEKSPVQLLDIEVDFTGRFTLSFVDIPNDRELQLNLGDTKIRFEACSIIPEAAKEAIEGVERFLSFDEGSALQITSRGGELVSEEKGAGSYVLISFTGGYPLSSNDQSLPLEFSAKKNGEAGEVLFVECILKDVTVKFDLKRVAEWADKFQSLTLFSTGENPEDMGNIKCLLYATSCTVVVPILDDAVTISSDDKRLISTEDLVHLSESPAAILLQLRDIEVANGALDKENELMAKCANITIHLMTSQIRPRSVKLLKLDNIEITSKPISFRSTFRNGFCLTDFMNSARSWEPDGRVAEAITAEVNSHQENGERSTKNILVNIQTAHLTVACEDVANLLSYFKREFESYPTMFPRGQLDLPQHNNVGMSIYIELMDTDLVVFHKAEPRIRLWAVDTYGACDCSIKDYCVAVQGLKSSIFDDVKKIWVPYIERAPQVQSKPAVLLKHPMMTMRIDQHNIQLRFANIILRDNGDNSLLKYIKDIYEDLGSLWVNSQQVSIPQRQTVLLTANDLLMESKGPVTSSGIASHLLLDITRVNFNTTVLVPTPPVQQYTITVDQIRLLLAENSGSYTTHTENHFVQVASLPGERALALKVTIDNEVPCIRAILDASELYLSFCADSLATFQRHILYLSSISEDDAHYPVSRMKTNFVDSIEEATSAGATGGGVSDTPGNTNTSDMDEEKMVEMLPCMEDFFLSCNNEPVEIDCINSTCFDDKDNDTTRSSAPFKKNADIILKKDEDDEWVMNGFYDTNDIVELEQWVAVTDLRAAEEDPDTGNIQETPPLAHWYDDAVDPGKSPEIRNHHVPIPTKKTSLQSAISMPRTDIQVNVQTITIRLFDGFDWASDPRISAANPDFEGLHNAPQTPINISSCIHNEYFDRGLPSEQATREYHQHSTDFRNERVSGNDERGRERESGRTKNHQPLRSTDNVVEVHITKAKIRKSDTRHPWKKFSVKLRAEESDKVVSHLNVGMDLNISYSAHGSTQNLLYEWQTARQAREEFDCNGNTIKMISVEISEVSQENWLLKNDNLPIIFDARLRPLRCCATWEVLDFLLSFCSELGPSSSSNDQSDTDSSNKTIVQRGKIDAISLKIDLDSRLVEINAIRKGKIRELLKLFTFSGVEVGLKPFYRREVKCSDFFANAWHSWVQDIVESQLHKFVAGCGPIRPLSTVGHTALNIVLLPLQQYREGGQILHGLRRGAVEFVKSLTFESVHASTRLSRYIASNLAYLAETAPASRPLGSSLCSPSVCHPQPVSVHSGLIHARDSFRSSMSTAAHAIIAIPIEDPVKGVIRAVPIAVLAPVVGAAEAVSFTLLGLRNSMNPDLRHDEEKKFKSRHNYSP